MTSDLLDPKEITQSHYLIRIYLQNGTTDSQRYNLL